MTDDDLTQMERRAQHATFHPDVAGAVGDDVRALVAEVRRLRAERRPDPPAAPYAHITEIDYCPHGG